MPHEIWHGVETRNAGIHTSKICTSKVVDEVVEFHLAVGFDVLVVKISVEHDDGERQKKHGIGSPELTHHVRVTLRITASKCLPHMHIHRT